MKQKHISVVLDSGAIAVAIARRVSVGKHVLLADLKQENAEKAAQTLREVLSAAQCKWTYPAARQCKP
ncbi:MAG: hypothetical protein ACTTJV_03725 [Ottowia sp.]